MRTVRLPRRKISPDPIIHELEPDASSKPVPRLRSTNTHISSALGAQEPVNSSPHWLNNVNLGSAATREITHPGGPVIMTACVRARPDEGANATLRKPSLPVMPVLMLIGVPDVSDAFTDPSFGLFGSVADMGVGDPSLRDDERDSLRSSVGALVVPALSLELTRIAFRDAPM